VPITSLSRQQIAQRIAVVAQREEIAFGYSVREVVMMGRAPHQFEGGGLRASAEDEAKVEDVLARTGLVPFAERKVNELSGGEQKRVAIARGLAQDADVLLLDEPAASLDVKEVVRLYDLLEAEVRRGRACLVVMHDLNVAAQYASRIVLLSKGKIVAQGAIGQVMTYAKLRETFETDLYVGVNELTGSGFYVPMRGR
jgi:iron complex transport system ATP-binding protein